MGAGFAAPGGGGGGKAEKPEKIDQSGMPGHGGPTGPIDKLHGGRLFYSFVLYVNIIPSPFYLSPLLFYRLLLIKCQFQLFYRVNMNIVAFQFFKIYCSFKNLFEEMLILAELILANRNYS